MRFEFTITLKDYKAALKLHRRRRLTRRIFPWIWPSLFLISLIAFGAASINKNFALASQAIALAAGSLAATIALPILRFFNTRRCYKQMFPPTRTSPITTIEIDDQRIVEENPGAEEVRLSWNGVLDFIQNEEVVMIYFSSHRFFLFPTSALSDSQRVELRELIARHVVKRKP